MSYVNIKRDTRLVNNLSDGNCMYYAYGISMMYYLKSLSEPVRSQHTAYVFNRLDLDLPEQQLLTSILNTVGNDFSSQQLNTIQEILGPAARIKAADVMISDLQQALTSLRAAYAATAPNLPSQTALNPLFNSSIYAALSGPFVTYFSIQAGLEPPLLDDTIYDSEIYKVPGIQESIDTFLQTYVPNPPPQFDLDQTVAKAVFTFLTDTRYNVLPAYENHLKRDRRWSTEEEIQTLHRFIVDERNVRRLSGLWEQECTIEIELDILKSLEDTRAFDGKYQRNDYKDKTPGLILYHVPGHWMSMIPKSFMQAQPSHTQPSPSISNKKDLRARLSTMLQDELNLDETASQHIDHVLSSLMQYVDQLTNKRIKAREFSKLCYNLLLEALGTSGLSEHEKHAVINQVFNTTVSVLRATWIQPEPLLLNIAQCYKHQLTVIERGVKHTKNVLPVLAKLHDLFDTHLGGETVSRQNERDFIKAYRQLVTENAALLGDQTKRKLNLCLKKTREQLHIRTNFQSFTKHVFKNIPHDAAEERAIYQKICEDVRHALGTLIFKLELIENDNPKKRQKAFEEFKHTCEASFKRVDGDLLGNWFIRQFKQFMNFLCRIFGFEPFSPNLARNQRARESLGMFDIDGNKQHAHAAGSLGLSPQ